MGVIDDKNKKTLPGVYAQGSVRSVRYQRVIFGNSASPFHTLVQAYCPNFGPA